MNAKQIQFIDAVYSDFEKAATERGVPIQFLIAQALIETGGRLHPKSKNLFGVKAYGKGKFWSGQKTLWITIECGRPGVDYTKVYPEIDYDGSFEKMPIWAQNQWGKICATNRYLIVKDWFRVYDSYYHSIQDRIDLFNKDAWNSLAQNDFKRFVWHGLANYATASRNQYFENIMKLAEPVLEYIEQKKKKS